MDIHGVVSAVVKQVTRDKHRQVERSRQTHYLYTRSYLYESVFAAIRYRGCPESDGVTYLFKYGKGWNGRNPRLRSRFFERYALWICASQTCYYLIPWWAIENFCSRPGSYDHPEYSPNFRLLHINTRTHQCRYTGKVLDFSAYHKIDLKALK